MNVSVKTDACISLTNIYNEISAPVSLLPFFSSRISAENENTKDHMRYRWN